MKEVVGFLRTAGPTLSPFNAWLFLKGLETLRIRMQAHSASALALAEWLERQPGIERVYYAGLPSHPQHELARRQQSGFGAVVSFDVKGGRDAAWRFIDATRMVSITTNLGDTKTTIAHPATTSTVDCPRGPRARRDRRQPDPGRGRPGRPRRPQGRHGSGLAAL